MKEEAMLAELAQRFDVQAHQIGQRREQLLTGAATVFAEVRSSVPEADVKVLRAKLPDSVRRVGRLRARP
jgi:ribosomal 50S subunit-associated protein YjgA (DUF615 family)